MLQNLTSDVKFTNIGCYTDHNSKIVFHGVDLSSNLSPAPHSVSMNTAVRRS